MDTERWLRVGDIFERLLEAPESEREKRLSHLCGDDQQLRGIVLSMLDSHESPRFSDAAIKTGLDTSRAQGTPPQRETPLRDSEQEGSRVGPWRLARRIGAGGMGIVWLAERADGQFKQRAALKLIKRGMDSEAVLARFLRERQILARLEHRNIAHLLDGGIAPDGRPYFAMEYVEGLPLLAYCEEHKLKLEDRLRLFLQVCTALRFAHAQHVVHRDIKPSNILVTEDGSVKLLDFGIAKLLQGDDELTSTLTGTQREQPMTPAYAAPEQIAGGEITQQTDVYALGCVFYELLSGHRPHDFSAASDAHAVLKIILATDPVAPGRLKLTTTPVPSKRLRGDLDTIALTALKQMPARRYASVAAFAADIENYLAGKPISARRDHVLYRSYKFLRRHRVGVAAIATVALIALMAITAVYEARPPAPFANTNASVAIVDFGSSALNKDFSWLRAALPPMLRNELAQGSKLRVLSDELVRTESAGLPAPTAGGYALPTLALLRARLATDYVVSGSYFISGSGADAKVRLDLVMQNAKTGEAVAALTQSSVMSDLPAFVEKVGAELRQQLGFRLVSAETKQRVLHAQPPSTDVARHMGIALDALRKSDAALARNELIEINVLAPNYAPAYAYLAEAERALGYDAKALAAAQQAKSYSGNLPEDQQLRIARQVAVQKADWSAALDLDRQMLKLSPVDAELHLALADDLLKSGNPTAAEEALGKLRTLRGGKDARADLLAAAIARVQGDTKAQAEYAQRALETAQARDETVLVAYAERQLGIAREQSGQLDIAGDLFQQAIAHYTEAGNPKGEADARTDLAILLAEENQVQRAQDEYQEALRIYQNIGDQRGLAIIFSNMTNLLWNRGNRDAAEAAVRRVLDISLETGDLGGQVWALIVLGGIQLDNTADAGTLETFRKAIALSDRSGERSQHVFALIKLSDALVLSGDVEQAADVCAQAQVEAKKLTDSQRETAAELQCAAVAYARGKYAQAAAALADAESSAKQHHISRDVAYARRGIAQEEMTRGDFETAYVNLGAATKEFADSERVADEAVTQSMLALCASELGKVGERDAAVARATSLRSLITTQRDAAIVDRLMAQVSGRSGRSSEAISRLTDLAAEARKRNWIALDIEARFAALEIMELAHDARASGRRLELENAARQSRFDGILARLASQTMQRPN